MVHTRFLAGSALACAFALAPVLAGAAPADYRFELAGKPRLIDHKDVVQVRLVRVADGKPVADAVIFETRADMGPAGMETMTAPVTPMPAKDGVYVFEIDPGMAGAWALHLAAKVQGEAETVRGTVTAELAK